MKITLEQLRGLKACASQVTAFEKAFGKEVNVSEAICVAHANTFNWLWAADKLLKKGAGCELSWSTAGDSNRYGAVIETTWAKYVANCLHNGSPIMNILPWADQNAEVLAARTTYHVALARAFAAACPDFLRRFRLS